MKKTFISFDWSVEPQPVFEAHMANTAEACIQLEGLEMPLGISVFVTDEETIRDINLRQRGIDRTTDVLSFPSVDFSPRLTAGQRPEKLREGYDPESGCYDLGEIIISLPAVMRQAQEYGHTPLREICYLTAHAMFHLMGYDHMNDEDRRRMRQMEEKALQNAGLARVTEDELLEKAREAMKFSYSPYSGYSVGAALLCTDGTVYTGCNVENSSYGMTICAERTAVFKAVSEGRRSFSAIAIAAQGAAPWPCGACRQVLFEFSPDMTVYITWDGMRDQAPLRDLLLHGFGPAGDAAHFLGGNSDK